MPTVAQPLPEQPTLVMLFVARLGKGLSIFRSAGSLRNACASIGISQQSQQDVPMN
jgi:hypothetical protein